MGENLTLEFALLACKGRLKKLCREVERILCKKIVDVGLSDDEVRGFRYFYRKYLEPIVGLTYVTWLKKERIWWIDRIVDEDFDEVYIGSEIEEILKEVEQVCMELKLPSSFRQKLKYVMRKIILPIFIDLLINYEELREIAHDPVLIDEKAIKYFSEEYVEKLNNARNNVRKALVCARRLMGR